MPPKLCIAFVSDFYYPPTGGIETHIRYLTKYLIAMGHRVVVITNNAYAHLEEKSVYVLDIPKVANNIGFPALFANFLVFKRIFEKEKVDVVHGHQTMSSLALEGIWHAQTMGIRTVMTDHSLFDTRPIENVIVNSLSCLILKNSLGICVSECGAKNYVRRIGCKRVEVVYNAVENGLFFPNMPGYRLRKMMRKRVFRSVVKYFEGKIKQNVGGVIMTQDEKENTCGIDKYPSLCFEKDKRNFGDDTCDLCCCGDGNNEGCINLSKRLSLFLKNGEESFDSFMENMDNSKLRNEVKDINIKKHFSINTELDCTVVELSDERNGCRKRIMNKSVFYLEASTDTIEKIKDCYVKDGFFNTSYYPGHFNEKAFSTDLKVKNLNEIKNNKNSAILLKKFNVNATYSPNTASFNLEHKFKFNDNTPNINIIVTSRLAFRKGVHILADALPQILKKHPNTMIYILGDGPMRDLLEQTIDDHNISQNVILMGDVPHAHIAKYLRRSHIFINTSLTETFCMTVVEAAMCGLHVVSTNVGAIQEVLPENCVSFCKINGEDVAERVCEVIECMMRDISACKGDCSVIINKSKLYCVKMALMSSTNENSKIALNCRPTKFNSNIGFKSLNRNLSSYFYISKFFNAHNEDSSPIQDKIYKKVMFPYDIPQFDCICFRKMHSNRIYKHLLRKYSWSSVSRRIEQIYYSIDKPKTCMKERFLSYDNFYCRFLVVAEYIWFYILCLIDNSRSVEFN